MTKTKPKPKSEQAWPADAVERRPVADLVPYAQNSRTHTDQQIAQVAASIEEWGWTTPVLIDEDGGIIAGHCRVMAAEQLGIEEVPCMVATGWTEAQKRAYVIADNKLAENAGWDDEILKLELSSIAEMDFDLDLIGFDDAALVGFLTMGGKEDADPDEVPVVPDAAMSREGDIWVLGNHRLICGSSTDADTVAAVLDGAKPHLMVTDPPYGVEYDANWRNEALAGKPQSDGKVGGGGRAVGKVKNDDSADWREAWALFPGQVAYVWHAGNMAHVVADSLISCDLDIRSQIIWSKSQLVIGRGNYHPMHEPCWYAVRKGKTARWNGSRKETTVWNIDKPRKSETGHSTQKPVECMQRPIENNSKPGEAVYEPFSGSGTTIIAAEITGRVCYAIELNPAYVDVAVRRWQDFTGSEAVLAQTGETFAQIEHQRAAG